MSSTADAPGSDAIMRRSAGEMQTTSATSAGTTKPTANTNTDPASDQRTIDANPVLADALKTKGVMADQIGAIFVQPNGQVVIYEKG